MNKYDLSDEEWRAVSRAIIKLYEKGGCDKIRDSILKKLGLPIYGSPYTKYHLEHKRKLDEIDRGFQARKMKEFNKLSKEERLIEMKDSKDD